MKPIHAVTVVFAAVLALGAALAPIYPSIHAAPTAQASHLAMVRYIYHGLSVL